MGNITIQKDEDGFSTLPNEVAEDESISWKAKGILLYLSGRPDGWEANKKDLINRATEGKTALQNGLDELKEAGYLEIEPDRRENGTLKGYKWTLTLLPVRRINRTPDKPDAGKPEPNKKECSNKEGNQKDSNSNGDLNEKVEEVWDLYLEIFEGVYEPRKLTDTRESKIKRRLDTYTVEEIEKAMRALRASDFHCGENDRDKLYCKPEFIFRNDEKVEEWLNEFEEDESHSEERLTFGGDPETRSEKVAESTAPENASFMEGDD